MKVSELEGVALDYWVARAMGEAAKVEDWGELVCVAQINAFEPVPFKPSTRWSDGGPIIEREEIATWKCKDGWRAIHPNGDSDAWYQDSIIDASSVDGYGGGSLLIAAMRAYVASKFGDEVPEEK